MAKRRAEPKVRSCCYCGLPTLVSRKSVSEPLKRYAHAPYPTEVPPLCVEVKKGLATSYRIRREAAQASA